MKYILSIGAFLLLIGGVFWYTSTPNMMGMNMDGMMMGQNIPEEDNIPVEDKAAGWNSAGAHLRKIIGGV